MVKTELADNVVYNTPSSECEIKPDANEGTKVQNPRRLCHVQL